MYRLNKARHRVPSRRGRHDVTRDRKSCGRDLDMGRIAQSLQQLFAGLPRQLEGADVSHAQARHDIADSREMLVLEPPSIMADSAQATRSASDRSCCR